MAANFRTLFRFLVPAWLSRGEGGLLLHTVTTLIDVHQQRLLDGVRSRFPSRAGTSALASLSYDRGLTRGRDETDAHFAERLKAWRGRAGHLTRGNAFAFLRQLSEYWGALACWTVDTKGNKRARAADGTETASAISWTWDTVAAAQWGRFWVVLDAGATLEAQDDFANTIGIASSTPYDWVAVRQLLASPFQWAPSGTLPQWLIVSLDGSAPTPDATWEYWGVAGDGSIVEPARSDDYRYVALRAELKDYAGEADRAAPAVECSILGFAEADLDDWTDTQITSVTAAGITTLTPSATPAVYHYISSPWTSFETDRFFTFAVKAKRGAGSYNLQLTISDPVNPDPVVKFDLSSGTVESTSNGGRGYCDGVPDGDGYYTCIFSYTGTISAVRIQVLDATFLPAYAGDGSTILVQEVLENLLAGNPESFPTTITMPDGSTYAGDSATFPATISLFDDGDIPE
jgi:hypothetical protein